MDNVIIFGQNQQEHDSWLHSALQCTRAAGLTLTPNKCEFNKQCITFLSHIIDAHGVSADPSKTSAVLEVETPRSVTELCRFMGMVNQLGKFTLRIAEISQPLRELLGSNRAWVWEPTQDGAFKEIKIELARLTANCLLQAGMAKQKPDHRICLAVLTRERRPSLHDDLLL